MDWMFKIITAITDSLFEIDTSFLVVSQHTRYK